MATAVRRFAIRTLRPSCSLAMSHSSTSARQIRVDPEHHLLKMMRCAIGPRYVERVSIQLNQSEVTLTGYVDYWSDKQLVQESLRGLCGSRTIHNHVEVECA